MDTDGNSDSSAKQSLNSESSQGYKSFDVPHEDENEDLALNK